MSQNNRKLGRTSDQRKAMLRAMVTYLLENGQIKTTVTRAKEVAPVAEKMITLAKKNDLAVLQQIGNHGAEHSPALIAGAAQLAMLHRHNKHSFDLALRDHS